MYQVNDENDDEDVVHTAKIRMMLSLWIVDVEDLVMMLMMIMIL